MGRLRQILRCINWLNVSGAGGEQTKWAIHNCYGDPVATAESIMGAFQRYQGQRVKQSQSQ